MHKLKPSSGDRLGAAEQYIGQTVRHAYHQGVTHASRNYSSATQSSCRNGYGAGSIVPQKVYQSDAFSGGVTNRQVITLGGKGSGSAWYGWHKAYLHSFVLREDDNEGGFKYPRKGAPELNIEEVV